MALIEADISAVSFRPAKKKRMLSVVETKDEITVFINYSSYDIITACLRKDLYSLVYEYKSKQEHPALTTGSGVHKAMEVWYSAAPEERKRGSFKSDDNIIRLLERSPLNPTGVDARIAAISAYLKEVESLRDNEELGARDPKRVTEILDKYFDYYYDDNFELYSDKDGPFLERSFELEIPLRDELFVYTFNDKGITYPVSKRFRVIYFGTIDMVLRNKVNGLLFVCDHKTASSMGKDFHNRIKPNFQYTGYYWGAVEAFGLKPDGFMVNGIQIAKTKETFERQITYIDEAEIKELHTAYEDAARQHVTAMKSGVWPMSSPNSCAQWGGCEYRKVCETPEKLRKEVINAEYKTS